MGADAPKPLTAKQQLFVQEYLVDLNATRAAKAAGYSQKNADKIGHQLLGNPRVQAAIAEAMAQRIQRTQVTADWTLRRLRWLADSNIRSIAKWGTKEVVRRYKKRGGDWDEIKEQSAFLEISESGELTKGQTYGIDSIKVVATEFGPSVSLKMRSPTAALEMLGRHQGIFEIKSGDTPQTALEEAMKRLDEEHQGSALDKAKGEKLDPARAGKDPQTKLQDQEESD